MIETVLILLAAVAVVVLSSAISETDEPLHSCKTCRYNCRNCTKEPCIYCDECSEWEKSTLEGQEWD